MEKVFFFLQEDIFLAPNYMTLMRQATIGHPLATITEISLMRWIFHDADLRWLAVAEAVAVVSDQFAINSDFI